MRSKRAASGRRRGTAAAVALALCAGVSCTSRGPDQGAQPPPTPVRFFREHVRVEVSEQRTRVVGLYDFRNDSDVAASVTIRYPFPVDRHHLYPFLIRVDELSGGAEQAIGFHRVDPDIAWRMSFAPREEKRVRVEYVQEIRERRATYIVTTTKQWGRPIETADFEFRVPASFAGVALSEQPDSVQTRADTVVYRLRRVDFMPEEDLTIRWVSDAPAP